MNAKTALLKSLLAGDTISIKTAFNDLGITNAPREVSRCVEKPFGVIVTRTHKQGKSRYGVPVTWMEYKLERTQENAYGIQRIAEYIIDNTIPPKNNFKTDKEARDAKRK